MSLSPKKLPSPLLAFGLILIVALGFAFYTNHTWEDYYITYRSSKNLATGHGLVFNLGDRLHTFTSPLGVLLPAVSYLLTFNTSDAGALWIFRLMSCAALGGGAALLMTVARQRNYAAGAGIFLLLALVTDAKSVDFSINGMETAFLLLFLAYALWAHLTPGPRQWLHLGAAWGGLMWSRPDSFIYIGLVAAGFWLFNREAESGVTRGGVVRLYIRAAGLTTILYVPWLLWAWGYYGTPVPHTITAKSGIGDPRTLAGVAKTAAQLLFTTGSDNNTLGQAFLPAYYIIGGWPMLLIKGARVVGIICGAAWLVPGLRRETRVASLAFFGGHVYLSYFPYFPFPWYLPTTALLGFLTLAGLVSQALDATGKWRWTRWPAVGLAVLMLAGTTWTLAQAGRQLAAQQRYIEEGGRRKIGEWLHEHAQAGDTVFMEPLGYIGFFSNLKTYDFPGMSSREMVAARAKVGNEWATLIQELGPRWLVLRPFEAERIESLKPGFLSSVYRPVQTFDQRPAVNALAVQGRNYLVTDSKFTVYRGERLMRFQTELGEIVSPFPTSPRIIDGVSMTLIHAPGSLSAKIPAKAKGVTVGFAYPPDAYAAGDAQTDGAVFSAELVRNGQVTQLVQRKLDPANQAGDRGVQKFDLTLPEHAEGDLVVFRTTPEGNLVKDWTCWGLPDFY